ncbi:MAG: 23S rRNA (adenine(2503)-C(2))-methyltransferase RlmN [Anaerolineae bacterium]
MSSCYQECAGATERTGTLLAVTLRNATTDRCAMAHSTALSDLTREQLGETLQRWGEPRYRANQIWHWMYGRMASSFDEMSDVPVSLRARLDREFVLPGVEPLRRQRSEDGATEKVLLRLADGETIETVLMASDGRQTVCVSTQVGCAIRCSFCATGLQGWTRNLTAGEIVEQVLYFARALRTQGRGITNVVYMGMGEPFLNEAAVLESIARCNDPQGLNLGARRITVSTAGVVPGIRRLADSGPPVGLAVSLHAASDDLRSQLMPVNQRYPLGDLLAACRYYADRTRRRVSFEYALLAGINDALCQADALADRLRGLLCHVNLIPANVIPDLGYEPSPQERVLAFQRRLQQHGITTTIRQSRGADIQAGCGQLRGGLAQCQMVVDAES